MVSRIGVWLLALVWLVSGQGIMAAPVPLPPTGGVRIESLTHDARRPLRVGDRVTVTVRGSIGGSATFHIFGVAVNLGMREIRTGVYQAQPALYTGTYIVRQGDVIRNGAVLATLNISGQEVMAASDRPITIDTRGPVITSRQPKPSAVLTNARPNIVVNFLDAVSGVNPGAVRLSVNGQNVTARASISDSAVAYNSEVPFAPGPVRVQLTAMDRAGNTDRTEWSFTIAPSTGLIKSVTINPATALTWGDILTVVMTGAPGGKASFAIQGVPGVVAMRESQTPGVYFGTLAVAAGLNAFEAPVTVTLEKDGRRTTATAAAGVSIIGGPPPAPTVLSSGRAIVLGEEAVTRTVLLGRSRPGLRIFGRLFFIARSPSGEEQRPLAEFLTVTGANGTWQIALGPLIFPEGARVVVSVVAIDPAGQRSPPVQTDITQ